MSVFIRKIQRPKNCIKCLCFDDGRLLCQAEHRSLLNEEYYERRPDWCPIIDVLTEQDLFGVEEQKWTPIEDGLPEGDCSTLICTANGSVCQARYYAAKKAWNGIAGKHAKFWMPLPLPPERE